MKKSINLVLAAAMTLGTFTAVADAAPNYVSVVLDGKKVYFPDAQPFIDGNGRTLVPVRFVTESLGAGVSWLGEIQTVAISYQGKDIRLKIGESKATVNGSDKTLDTQVILKGNRTFVPLRFVSESLNANVIWDGNTSTVVIQTVAAAGSTAKLDPYGRKIRTTNLPSNAQDYPYILEDVPNEMYEMKYVNDFYSRFAKPTPPAAAYKTIPQFTKHNVDIWMDRVKKYYSLAFNVDYHTIDYNFAEELFSNCNRAVNFRYLLKDYVDWVKTNQIQIEGYLDPEPSMTYYVGAGKYLVRSTFKFRFINYSEQKNLFYETYFPTLAHNSDFQKGVWYVGYVDIPLSTNVGGNWGETLAVERGAIFSNIKIKED